MLLSSRTAWQLLPLVLALAACGGLGEDDSYYALRARVTTGQEGSDGDVTLCWTESGTQSCEELSSDGNDFESGSTNTFDLSLDPRVEHGTKFTGFQLQYSTGISVGDTWDLAGLRISLYFGDGEEELVCDASLSQTLSGGDAASAAGCP